MIDVRKSKNYGLGQVTQRETMIFCKIVRNVVLLKLKAFYIQIDSCHFCTGRS